MAKIFFTCSFDDGDVADLRLANLLDKYKIKATFYIPQTCEFANKSLCEKQIADLSCFMEIGGHTISHQILTRINDDKAKAEIFDCKKWLEDVIEKPVQIFCPPTGRFNHRHISFQQEAGFKSMRTVEMLSYSVEKIKTVNDFVILPTTSQVFNHTRFSYLKNQFKRLRFNESVTLWKLFDVNWAVMSKNYIDHFYTISEESNSQYYFHLWGHSWEIEEFSLWESLEYFLSSLNDVEDIIFCNNSEVAEVVRSNKK